MNLREACEMGRAMGCQTIGEVILNVEHQATSLFRWSEMASELKELVEEASEFTDDTLIEEVFKFE